MEKLNALGLTVSACPKLSIVALAVNSSNLVLTLRTGGPVGLTAKPQLAAGKTLGA